MQVFNQAIQLSNGATYEGEWFNGKRDGQGRQ